MARGPFWADGPPKENGPGGKSGAASHKECGPRSDTSGCSSVESTGASQDASLTSRILGIEHWRAAQKRRAGRLAAIERGLRMPVQSPLRLTLDDILGPVHPDGGDAA
jgi:hypothetical protein